MRGAALAALMAAVVIVAVEWGTFVAGGSDSYCYVHQAQRWAAAMRDTVAGPLTGRLQVPEPLALEAPWPEAPATFVPVGHVPSPTEPGAIAPMCPAGLSMAMAPFVLAAGPDAAFVVVPIFAALLVLATYAAGARFGKRVGMAAALMTAASPAFLYQAVQPMSDVPAAALWMAAVAAATGTSRRQALVSGLATSAAILMRPNLVPLGFAIGLFLLLRPERTWSQRVRAAATYAAASAIGCAGVALVQQTFFGSPLTSGYGSLAALFGIEHVAPNLRAYLIWLLQTHTPVIALAIPAVWLLPGAVTALYAGLFTINLALYLPYVQFDHWSYLRFLLPTIPIVLILAAAAVDALTRRTAGRIGGVAEGERRIALARVVLGIVTVALAVIFVREAQERSAFRLHTLESRFARAGLVVRHRLPPNALIVTASHSGSVRFYADRKTLAWDVLEPAWLERALAFVRARGYEPYLLLETGEEPAFRRRFEGTPIGRLDWPPAVEVAGQVRIYRPGDRVRYLERTAPPTEYVR